MIKLNRNHYYNKIKYLEHDEYVEGIMPDGKIFLISKKDYPVIKENCWHYDKDGYLKSSRLGLMHRFIMKDKLSGKLQVDHINMNKTDNRQSNLQVVTQQENLHKKSKYSSNTSGHTGVKWNKRLSKWQVQITRNKQRVHLGVFDNLQDAVIARRKAEVHQ